MDDQRIKSYNVADILNGNSGTNNNQPPPNTNNNRPSREQQPIGNPPSMFIGRYGENQPLPPPYHEAPESYRNHYYQQPFSGCCSTPIYTRHRHFNLPEHPYSRMCCPGRSPNRGKMLQIKEMQGGSMWTNLHPSEYRYDDMCMEDGNGCSRFKRKRALFTQEQLETMNRIFREKRYLSSSERMTLSKQIKVGEKQIKIWWQNKRNKEKLSTPQAEAKDASKNREVKPRDPDLDPNDNITTAN